jgi:hypothetical protein
VLSSIAEGWYDDSDNDKSQSYYLGANDCSNNSTQLFIHVLISIAEGLLQLQHGDKQQQYESTGQNE